MEKFNQQFNITKEELDKLVDKKGYYVNLDVQSFRDGHAEFNFRKYHTRNSLLYSTVTHPREGRKLHIVDDYVIIDYTREGWNYYPSIKKELEEFLNDEK